MHTDTSEDKVRYRYHREPKAKHTTKEIAEQKLLNGHWIQHDKHPHIFFKDGNKAYIMGIKDTSGDIIGYHVVFEYTKRALLNRIQLHKPQLWN